MRAFIVSILVLFIAISATAQNTVQQVAKGFVFHDANENRLREDGEKGIPEVAVSNGLDIVLTDKDGAYEIPVSDNTVLFVIKPSDWMTPLNEENLPQFYYLHKPNGYPENFIYKAVEPTGALPDEINFPLYREESSENYKVVVFGDPQPYNIEMIDFLSDDIINELIGKHDLKFGMTMGDIVGDDLNLFSPINQVVSKLGIPWYNVLGNHDVNYMAPTDELSDETYESVYGPATYAFVYGDVHFIVVDDVIHESQVGSRSYVGGLRPDQLEFVANYLELAPKNHLIVLAMHVPLVQHGESFRQSDQKKLFDLLKDFPNTLSISAHTHVHNNVFFHQDSTDWQQAKPHHHFNVGTTSGSWWNGMRNEVDVPHTMMRDGTPNGYSFITFKGTEYVIDWKVAGSPADHKMNIHLPRFIVANESDTVLLSVNFFNGSEESTLEYRIGGRTGWKEMEKVNKYDPYYLKIDQRWKRFKEMKLREEWEETYGTEEPLPGTPMPAPNISTHLWEANIGSDFPAGRHVIEVRAKDRYGRVFTDVSTIRVVEE
ncbi:MAG TPA: calcineurin-like phosphoesterase family protein [Saprospiraceae bacterium]|nr:calcineurin-like phosphoesterase family protein [Saprospiraceae bacterium]